MGKVILGVTVSMDGYAEDRKGSVGSLYPDLDKLRNTETLKRSIRNTGAVIMAWKEYAMAGDPDWFVGNYEYQVPIFVITDRVPDRHPREDDRLKFTYVTDGMKSAVRRAKAAAGGKDVTIIGSVPTIWHCMQAGLADELHLDIIPIFLRAGFRPFEDHGNRRPRLERVMVEALPAGRTHLEYRVVK